MPNKTQKARLRKLCATLRSGKYAQATSKLRCDDKFCCLGVACDVYDPTKWNEDLTYSVAPGYTAESAAMPAQVVEYYGFDTPWGFQTEVTGELGLGTYNDSLHKTLPEIADIIEAHYDLAPVAAV